MNSDKKPRILVCTINAWNSKVGDNTFPMLLEGYPKELIASLFIREDNPDSQVCDKYFRISEKRIMKSIFKRRIKTGYKVLKNETIEKEEKPKQYIKKTKFYYSKLICREIIWKIGKWKTKELNQFIDDFSPNIVIYEMSRYIHFNNIIKYILKKTNAVGVGCFWDDTFTYKQEKSFGYKFLRFFQRKNLKRLAKKTSTFFSITPKTKKEADKFFKINSVVLTKPLPQILDNKTNNYIYPLKMLYTGNVGIGRLEVIKKIIEELKKINENDVKITLDIYTNTNITTEDKIILNTHYSHVYPPISQKEVLRLQKESDILLFVESLGKKNKVARLSFSTKITDYYAAGKCIFAVGNEDLAPIELFKDTDSAIIVTKDSELLNKLKLLLNLKIVEEYAKKSFDTGIKNHSSKDIINTFYENISRGYGLQIENQKKNKI